MNVLRILVLVLLVVSPVVASDGAALHEKIAAVCPIDGVSIGRVEDKGTWRISYAKGATEDQRAAAEAVVAGWSAADFHAGDVMRSLREVSLARARLIGAQQELDDALKDSPDDQAWLDALTTERDTARKEVDRLRAAAKS